MDLFGDGSELLTADEKSDLLARCTEMQLATGGVLFDYHDPAEQLYFLREGHLAVHKFTGFQEKMQVVALLDPGAVVGEAALLVGHVRKTRVVAIAESRLACLQKKDFAVLQQQAPETACRLLQYFLTISSLRLEKTSERLARIL